MFYDHQIPTTLHIELSTKCNASCPMCSRNNGGYGQNDKVISENLSLCAIQQNLSTQFIVNLKRLIVCGNFGDPLMSPELIEIFKYFKSLNQGLRIELHTNGGIGSIETWNELASLVHFCRFGIDGLQDTNHIYRRGVKWARLMENINAFITSGGNAEWAFIAFLHNQHQIDQAKLLSERIGFKKFIVKRSNRQMQSNGEYIDKWPVYKNKNEIEYFIQPADDEKSKMNKKLFKNLADTESEYINYLNSTPICCKVKTEKSVYLSVDGLVFPCCWLAVDYTLKESSQNSTQDLMRKIESSREEISIFNQSIESIVSGQVFSEIEKSWISSYRIQKCARVCGAGFDPFKTQF